MNHRILSQRYRDYNDLSYYLKLVLFASLYFVAGKIGLSLAYIHPNASAIWPPTGIALSILILKGIKYWPSVFIGAFFVNVTTAGSVLTSFGIAVGNSCEAVLGAYFVKLFIDDSSFFSTPLNVVKFIWFAGILATLVSTIIGITSLLVGGYLSAQNIFTVAWTWWLGDIGGALILAPFILLWVKNFRIKPDFVKLLEYLLILSIITIISVFTYGDGIPNLHDIFPLIFVTIPFIIWIAVRFSPRETSTAILFLYLVTIWLTFKNIAPELEAPSNEALILIQIYMGILFIGFMPLAADIQQKKLLRESLQQRIEQQRVISELGIKALSGNNLDIILKDSVRLIYETLKVDYCKVLKLLPGGKELLMIEGIGWENGIVGKAVVSADTNSQAGYTLLSKEPVIVSDFPNEKRFNGPPLLSDHHVLSGMSCIIYGKDKPFGVLGAHSRSRQDFSDDDVYFFQSISNIIGMAIERFSFENRLVSSLNEKQILIKEIHHRVKNNLQIVSSLLSLQSGQLQDNSMLDVFEKSKARIRSMALIYKLLHNTENISNINFKDYLKELTDALINSLSLSNIRRTINAEDIYLKPDQATNLGLIVNEIISNSIKHAFKSQNDGCIKIDLSETNDKVKLVVKDNGKGFPYDFDLSSSSTLGVQLINNLVEQLPGEISIKNDSGVEYIIEFIRE